VKRCIPILATSAAVILAAIVVYVASHTDTRAIRSDETRLEIPLEYFDNSSEFLAFFQSLPGLDRVTREILLTVNASEVAQNVPRYQSNVGKYNDDLRLRVTILKDTEIRRYNDPDTYRDLKNASGSYVERIVEFDRSRGFARVYRKAEYPNSWEVFRVPGSQAELPTDLYTSWVAHCLKSGSPLTASGQLALCKSHILVGNIAVHFTVSDENLPRIEHVKSYLHHLVLQWQRKTAV